MNTVRIRGRGIAASTVAWMLAGRKQSLVLMGPPAGNSLQIAVNADTVSLIDDIFGIRLAANPEARWIERRVICGWREVPEVVESPSLSLPAKTVAECLEKRVRECFGEYIEWCKDDNVLEGDSLTIDSIGPGHPLQEKSSMGLTFGKRLATTALVKVEGPNEVSILERTPNGWLFLLPSHGENAMVNVVVAQTCTDPAAELKAAISSSSLGEVIRNVDHAHPWRRIAPSLQHPLATRRVIRVGEAAFTFDPICGDGVGYAIRSALLASTVSLDLFRGDFRGLNYYHARLTRTFCAHLQACCKYYDGWQFAGWRHELAQARHGVAFLHGPSVH